MVSLENVKRYCKEYWRIENYDQAMADESQVWDCHHRHEIDWALPMEELIAIGRYYDVHYSELIFLTPCEHMRLHNTGGNNPMYGKEGYWKGKEGPNKNKRLPEETREKMSNSKKGKPKTKEVKDKISKTLTKFDITSEELYNLYVLQNLAQTQIAELFGCSLTCIHHKLKKFDIRK